nr:retrovirus-related Pol polyprotein from transposon TNT 1-94 [Ipomoea batatas]
MEATRRLLLVLRRQLEPVEVQPPGAVSFARLRRQQEVLLGATAIDVEANRLHHFRIAAPQQYGRNPTSSRSLRGVRESRSAVEGHYGECESRELVKGVCPGSLVAWLLRTKWFTWLHLMQNKSEARQFIKKLHAMLLTHFGVLIKTVRTDNELEFNMPEFFEEHGIVH